MFSLLPHLSSKRYYITFLYYITLLTVPQRVLHSSSLRFHPCLPLPQLCYFLLFSLILVHISGLRVDIPSSKKPDLPLRNNSSTLPSQEPIAFPTDEHTNTLPSRDLSYILTPEFLYFVHSLSKHLSGCNQLLYSCLSY